MGLIRMAGCGDRMMDWRCLGRSYVFTGRPVSSRLRNSLIPGWPKSTRECVIPLAPTTGRFRCYVHMRSARGLRSPPVTGRSRISGDGFCIQRRSKAPRVLLRGAMLACTNLPHGYAVKPSWRTVPAAKSPIEARAAGSGRCRRDAHPVTLLSPIGHTERCTGHTHADMTASLR